MPYRFESLSDLHKLLNLPGPLHPLITIVHNNGSRPAPSVLGKPHTLNFYKISYRKSFNGKLKYGQSFYDFNHGGLLFVSPNQLISTLEDKGDNEGCSLFIHPDYLLSYPLAKKIKQYGFFSYSANEALHLSESEKEIITAIFQLIETELKTRIDDFSQDVIISQIELLLNYANRFYKRQFITRKAVNNGILEQLDAILDNDFMLENSLNHSIPTVQHVAERLNISPGYLSDMLRTLIGQNAQQYIHSRLIAIAKEKLSTTELSIREIAYQLGFEHPQSFSKLFKSKTSLSPLEFRQSFN